MFYLMKEGERNFKEIRAFYKDWVELEDRIDLKQHEVDGEDSSG